jgi:hypothetical protein
MLILWLAAVLAALAALAAIGSLRDFLEPAALINLLIAVPAIMATTLAGLRERKRAVDAPARDVAQPADEAPRAAPIRQLAILIAVCLLAPLVPAVGFGFDRVVRLPPIRLTIFGDTFPFLLWASWVAAIGLVAALASWHRYRRVAAGGMAFATSLLLLAGAEAAVFLGFATLAPFAGIATVLGNIGRMTWGDTGSALVMSVLPVAYWVVCAVACTTSVTAMRHARAASPP